MSNPGRTAIALALALLGAGPAGARDVYVDATTGSDTTGTGGLTAPWKRITHALGQGLVSGDHIRLAAGTYDASGNGEAFPIDLPEGVSLHGSALGVSRVRNDSSTPTVPVVLRLTTGSLLGELWVVERLEIFGVGRSAGSIGVLLVPGKGAGPDLRDNDIHGLEAGIAIDHRPPAGSGDAVDSRAFIDGNLVRDNQVGLRFAISLTDPPARVRERSELLNNRIIGNGTGIELSATCGGCGAGDLQLTNVVVNNTIADNSGDGLRTLGGDCGGTVDLVPEVMNDIIAFNGGKGVNEAPCGVPVVETSLFWQNALGGDGLPPNLLADPQFVDRPGGDYHITATSPAVDAGTDPVDVATDMDREPRPFDGNGDTLAVTDIGADEYRPAPVDLRRAVFASIAPVSPAVGLAFPFDASNPLTPVVKSDFVNGDADPNLGILTDPRVPMAFYQVAPAGAKTLYAVKDPIRATVVFTLQ